MDITKCILLVSIISVYSLSLAEDNTEKMVQATLVQNKRAVRMLGTVASIAGSLILYCEQDDRFIPKFFTPLLMINTFIGIWEELGYLTEAKNVSDFRKAGSAFGLVSAGCFLTSSVAIGRKTFFSGKMAHPEMLRTIVALGIAAGATKFVCEGIAYYNECQEDNAKEIRDDMQKV